MNVPQLVSTMTHFDDPDQVPLSFSILKDCILYLPWRDDEQLSDHPVSVPIAIGFEFHSDIETHPVIDITNYRQMRKHQYTVAYASDVDCYVPLRIALKNKAPDGVKAFLKHFRWNPDLTIDWFTYEQ